MSSEKATENEDSKCIPCLHIYLFRERTREILLSRKQSCEHS